jgi:hypothetical protein
MSQEERLREFRRLELFKQKRQLQEIRRELKDVIAKRIEENTATDSSNRFEVCQEGQFYFFTLEPIGKKLRLGLLASEALNLAAWLSSMADPDGSQFSKLVSEIKRPA